MDRGTLARFIQNVFRSTLLHANKTTKQCIQFLSNVIVKERLKLVYCFEIMIGKRHVMIESTIIFLFYLCWFYFKVGVKHQLINQSTIVHMRVRLSTITESGAKQPNSNPSTIVHLYHGALLMIRGNRV